jgi:chemotaxis protein methyltransferase CheR
MDTHTFDAFRQIVYEKAGININENKGALVAARIGKRMRELSMPSDRAYLDFVVNDETGGEIINLLDVISTNVTSFFRESAHFDFLSRQVAEWFSKGKRKFRFWSAASSSGEEPYTIAMTVATSLGGPADVKILATDISTRILAKCAEACYGEAKVEPIPQHMRSRFFDKRASDRGTEYRVKHELKDLVTFTRLNLSKPPFPMTGPFDAVFCRNVMIYFDNPVRKRLLEEIFRLVATNGYLFVGHAESLTGLLSGFRSIMPSVYIKE